jgi:hypothetical protein
MLLVVMDAYSLPLKSMPKSGVIVRFRSTEFLSNPKLCQSISSIGRYPITEEINQ